MDKIKKTKIVCTIGPATETPEMVEKLANAGMNVVRMNFSHDIHENHLKRMEMVREISERIGINLAIMLDTKGPEIRCGIMENDRLDFTKGDLVKVVSDPELIGTKERISISVPEVIEDVKVGDYILIDDGKIRLDIIEVGNKELTCRLANSGPIKTRKGVNVPNVVLSMPFISDKDESDIRFGAKNNVDFIAASFVRRAEDVKQIRAILESENKPNIQIIAKIENQEGVDNIDSILEAADGVMVARGDLGVEVKTELVPIYQKRIIARANIIGKAVITATHMLDSMVTNPRPTRAEASDVANAILDGTDAIMLSAESAAGDYPIEAVTVMNNIAHEIENIIPYRSNLDLSVKTSLKTIQDSIGIAITEASLNLEEVEAIIAFTQSGNTARRISKYRPPVPVLAVTFTKEVQRGLEACWGVIPIYSDVRNDMTNDDELASIVAKTYGIEPGRLVIITAGYPTGEGTANMMKIVKVK